MADKTKIEWADRTWNPVSGCTRVSPGCDNCYIDWSPPFRIHDRHFRSDCPSCAGMGSTPTEHVCSDCAGTGRVRSNAVGSSTGVELHPNRLTQPLSKWKAPSTIFVNSLSDLFHDDIPDSYIARVWAVMATARQHRFIVLTKRHARMRSLLASAAFEAEVAAYSRADGVVEFPLSNVEVGVTTENQRWADARVPALLATPAATRLLSCEPLVGAVDLSSWVKPHGERCLAPDAACSCDLSLAGEVDWVIVGGESGRDARPMHPQWARRVRDQCVAAGVAFFFQQWGAWAPVEPAAATAGDVWVTLAGEVSPWVAGEAPPCPDAALMRKMAKQAAGRLLDDVEWSQTPSAELRGGLAQFTVSTDVAVRRWWAEDVDHATEQSHDAFPDEAVWFVSDDEWRTR